MKRVLVIDDAAFMRMAIKKILVKNGYEVVGEGVNGEEGVRLFNELRPDIVTLDITMPLMDGLTALKAIKAIDSSAKVVIVSAMGQESFVKEAIVQGAKSFIVKPFIEEHVIKVLGTM